MAKKSDVPPLRMVVGQGKLTPADPYSEELLDAYRIGSEVECRLSLELTAKKIRRYFAILRRAVQDCPTPWASTDEADQALKLACGVTRQVKTLKGSILKYPGSLHDLGEGFDDYFEYAMAVLAKIIGVDPLTLGRENDTEETQSESSGNVTSPPDDDGSGSKPSTQTPPAAGPAADASESPPRPASAAATLKHEAIDKIIALAKDGRVSVEERLETLADIGMLKGSWGEKLGNGRDFLDALFSTGRKIVRQEITPDLARQYLSSLIKEDT